MQAPQRGARYGRETILWQMGNWLSFINEYGLIFGFLLPKEDQLTSEGDANLEQHENLNMDLIQQQSQVYPNPFLSFTTVLYKSIYEHHK